MTVTKAVIEDLLPLYAAGELSEDSRKLVDEYLVGDPGLRARLKSAVGQAFPAVRVPATVETAAVGETRRIVRNSNHLWGLSFGLSYLAMACAFDTRKGLTFLMARDMPALALLFCTFGIFAWFLLMRTKARLKSTGMAGDWGYGTGMFFASFAVTAPLALTLSPFIGPLAPLVQLGIAFGAVMILRS